MRRFSLAILLVLAAVSSARATANLDCEIDDKSAKGAISAIMGRSIPGLMQIEGEIEVRAKGVPEDFKKVKLTGENLPPSWAYARELKLHAYKERQKAPFASFELVIETKAVNDESYRGGYELKINFQPSEGAENKTIALRGKASCSLG